MKNILKSWICVFCLIILSGCGQTSLIEDYFIEPVSFETPTPSRNILRSLPAASAPITVSVYGFLDKTGQNKPNETGSDFSKAVTQGGVDILKEALLDAGNQKWFEVLERSGLNDLLQERKIITAMREQYSRPGIIPQPLPPLLYAGLLLEGGIISYDSNIYTGGMGASYLGISGSTQYRRDVVTVYLRAVNVQNGKVILSVNTSKTIFSTSLKSGIFKFVGFDKLLELEGGTTINEPPQLAVRQAIEASVYALIMEGVEKNVWAFADANKSQQLMEEYLQRKNGIKHTIPQITKQENRTAPTYMPSQVRAAIPQPNNIVKSANNRLRNQLAPQQQAPRPYPSQATVNALARALERIGK